MDFRWMYFHCALASGFLVGGCCDVDLGPCDELAARTVVYQADGTPSYVGQALIGSSCGGGSICHARDATDRYGVPMGLDFDMDVACTETGEPCLEDTSRLARGRENVVAHSKAIVCAIEDGTMPPSGALGERARNRVPAFVYGDGATLGAIEDEVDALKNWLACRAPVVERTTPRPPGVPRAGDVVLAPGSQLPPPFFSKIYDKILAPNCAESCHASGAPELLRNQLDLSDPSVAYSALVGAPASGEACAGEPVMRVVPHDPDGSLLIQKLEGHGPDAAPICGAPMPLGSRPLGADRVEVIRLWIESGALQN